MYRKMIPKMHLALLIISLSQSIRIARAVWENPPFLQPDPKDAAVLRFEYDDDLKRLEIDLEEEVEHEVCVAVLNYKDNQVPSINSPSVGELYLLGAEIRWDSATNLYALWIKNKQDAETPIMLEYRFRISVESYTFTIALYVIDIDDNPPVIQALNDCTIKENCAEKPNCTFKVRDADGGMDKIQFTLTSVPEGNNFQFITTPGADQKHELDGFLNVTKCLDFEAVSMYKLFIQAIDEAKNPGSLETFVQVIDMPDQPPRWTQITAVENIMEKSTKSFEVRAIDGDVQINAEISYAITVDNKEDEKYFKVDSKTGEITINEIDRDTLNQDFFQFLIIAYETNAPEWRINSTIVVMVQDINDHSPVISEDVLKIEIEEGKYTTLNFDSPIVIKDPDLAENGQFSVSLIDNSEHSWSSAFLIVPMSGYQSETFTISVANASLLDFEDANWRTIDIQVQAIEKKNISHIGTNKIRIELKNLNDELPIFDENIPSSVNVPEDVDAFYSIATVHATDRDIDDNVTHTLLAQRMLKIDEKTGEIITNEADVFDYESMSVVVVQIVATDLANHKTYATLTINVQDVNDVPPELHLPRTSPRLEEEVPVGTEVETLISATDVDSDAELQFSIDWANTRAQKLSVDVDESLYKNHLEIRTTRHDDEGNKKYAEGKLVVIGKIDYEKFDVIFITISVTDLKTVHNANTTSATLILYIEDINDNAPIFVEPFDAMEVPENQVKDSLIGTVTATDADGPSFSNIFYSIKPINNTKDDLVVINGSTGVLKVGLDKAIDADAGYEYLYYELMASDGYNNSPKSIKIYVIDLNDEQPYLVDKEFNSTIHIPEKSPNGTTIVRIQGKDDDRTSPFNNVSYLISGDSSASMQYFSMGKFDGWIRVNLVDGFILDRDAGPSEFTLLLRLRDNYLVDYVTSNTNTFDTSLTIILDDINDKQPVLPDRGNPAAIITENTNKGDRILEVVAQDDDEKNTINTQVVYEIKCIVPIDDKNIVLDEQCRNIFSLNPLKKDVAEILANSNLKGYYGLWCVTLYAHDMGINPGPQNYTRNYTIQVKDFNYDRPKIQYPTDKIIPLRKLQTVGEQLITYDNRSLSNFIATDEDYGNSGVVTFSLTSTSDEHKNFYIISISKNVAQLCLAKPIDVEEKDTYKLTLIAKDGGNPSNEASQNFTLMFVTNSGPKYDENEWTVWIKENQIGPDTSATIPYARDTLDQVEENVLDIYYFLMPDEDSEYFELNKTSRILTVKKSLDREEKGKLIIRVVATTDNNGPVKNPPEKAVLTITVIVLDDNDNPPVFVRKNYGAGVAVKDSIDKIILTVEATDADLNDTLKYDIVANSMTTSHSSLIESANAEPFSVNEDNGNLALKFMVTSTMEGYFEFDISARDSANHTDTTKIQVYVVPESSRVVFTFNNMASYVRKEELFVIDSFTNAFGYTCNVDDIKSTVDSNDQIIDNSTTMTSHFISSTDHLPIESDAIILMSNSLQTISNLKAILLTKSLYLSDVPTGSSNTTTDIQETIQWILASLTLIFFLCSVTLVTAYVIRMRRLNKRLEKLAITKYGSQESGLDRAGIVPTTNQFATAGSNPMWKTPERSIGDDVSQGSGDSDLIGIEDNPNFGYVNGGMMNVDDRQNTKRGIVNPIFTNPDVTSKRYFD